MPFAVTELEFVSSGYTYRAIVDANGWVHTDARMNGGAWVATYSARVKDAAEKALDAAKIPHARNPRGA